MYQIISSMQQIKLSAGELFLIGRGEKCDLQLDDASASRVHCRLLVRKNRVFLTDAGSRWGTFVNGERVTETELSIGDEIAVGETILRLSAEGHAAATTLLPPKRIQSELPDEEFSSSNRDEHILPKYRSGVPISISPPWIPNRFLNTSFQGYQVQELVANTRTGMTFKAVHRDLDRTVALKVFRPELLLDEADQARFLRAVRTMIDVRFSGVVQLYDAGEWSGVFYTVSEFIDGSSAAELIKQIGIAGMLDWRTTLRIASDLAETLVELHEQGIVHRNLKPEHILVRASDHKAMLSDLLLAKAWNDTQCQQITQQGDCIGELSYQSPELLGSGEPIDHRSDLYQLGVMLYALLTGKLPFDAKGPASLVRDILSSPIPSPRESHLSIPELFNDLVIGLLSKQPANRPKSATELLNTINRIKKFSDLHRV